MSTVPTKRRKMRPNNAIAVAKLDKARLSNAQATSTELVSEKEKNNQKNSNVDKNQTNQTEKKRQSGIKRVRKLSIDKSTPEAKKNKTATTKEKKLSTPKPVTYSSASDSDETDDETRSRYAKNASVTPTKVTTTVMSASDSDETDIEEQKKNTLTQKQQRKIASKSKSSVLSASDSDETDTEQANSKKPSKLIKKYAQVSDSDSDETDQEQRSSKPKKSAQQMSASDSDDTDIEERKKDTPQSDSDSDSSSNGQDNTKKAKSKPKDKSHLSVNRISFRRTQEYDESKSAADNVKNRLSDLFVPEVNEDFFISDSDSETDSGEDYDSKQYPSWQRTLSASHNQEKDPWPKQRKLGYSDKLRLEKRVKKICRREGISFNQVRHIFSSSHRAEYVRFFQKIGKIFPDMSLHRLAKLCKEMYHEKRNMGPWTKDEIKKLEELLKIHGNSPTLISEHINRSPKNISDYLYSHGKTPKKVNVKWTKEEDEILAREAAKILKKDGKISFHTIEPLFKGTRTQKQIHTRYQAIRNLIQPDGTLAKKRKATEYEELRYLKRLMNQVREHRLVEESQLDFAKDRGFVHPKFYLKNRAMIKGFENMSIKSILQTLIDKQKRIIESRKEEKLLESEPESD